MVMAEFSLLVGSIITAICLAMYNNWLSHLTPPIPMAMSIMTGVILINLYIMVMLHFREKKNGGKQKEGVVYGLWFWPNT